MTTYTHAVCCMTPVTLRENETHVCASLTVLMNKVRSSVLIQRVACGGSTPYFIKSGLEWAMENIFF